jgi:major membrane immunogen (membrane-anchored lipoprotein)
LKKWLGVLLLAALLTACGNSEETSSSEPKEEAKPAEQKEVSNEEPETQENGKVVFTEAGQKGDTETGTLELLKIKNVNETINIAPITVTVKDIKLFKLTNMSEETKTEFEIYNDSQPIGDELFYVQVLYDAENTEEKNIGWYDLMNVVTDKGQQIDAMVNDMIYTDTDGDSEFLGKVKKEFGDGFIVKDADITTLKLIFGSSFDVDTYEDITAEQQVEYSF